MRHLLSPRIFLILLLLPTSVLVGCGTTTNLVTGETQRGAYSWAEEVQIGTEADQQITAQYGLYDDARLASYVEELGQAVLETSAYGDPSTPAEVRNTPFYFRVLDSPVVNAFALPGGYVYVTRGLLAHLDNEAQLAVVLGHEIGHVLARHASRRAASAQLGQFGLLGAAVLGGVVGGGDVAQGILEYGSTGVGLLFLKYSRNDEREADRAGVAYAEFAGYDAAEAARFFRSLQRIGEQAGASGIPNFLSTHPNPEEREQSIPLLAAQYDTGTAVNTAQFLAQLEGMVLGDDPRQGYTEDGTFYHPELRFKFDIPSGWQVQNQPTAVSMGEPNGNAVMEFTFAQESTAQAAANAFTGQQGISVSQQGSLTVNGNRAYRVAGSANTQNGQVGFIATFIEFGGTVYRFMGLTAANALSTYSNTFDNAQRSFARLTDNRYLNRSPVRIAIVEANRTAAFSSFLSGRPSPPGLDETGLAIMNQVDLNSQISSGSPLKLPSN